MTTTVTAAREKLQAEAAAADADIQRQYSNVVRKAAADKKLTAADVQAAADAAEILGLAPDAFDADVVAMRHANSMQQTLGELEKLQHNERIELEALRSELANLERRVFEVRRQQRAVGGRGVERGTLRSQLSTLRLERPHLWPREVAR